MNKQAALDSWLFNHKERALKIGGCKSGKPTQQYVKDCLKQYKGPKRLPDFTHIPQSEGKRWMPPGGYLWRSRTDNVWCSRYSFYPERAAADSAHAGEGGSLVECLRHAWYWYLKHFGLDEEHCPIPGFLNAEA